MDCRIIGEHGDHSIRLEGIVRPCNHRKPLDLCIAKRGPVPEANLMAGVGDVFRHRTPHPAETDETYFHHDSP